VWLRLSLQKAIKRSADAQPNKARKLDAAHTMAGFAVATKALTG